MSRAARSRRLLIVRHVSWEGPHRILDAFHDVPVEVLDVLEDDARLPPVENICGAIVMGGPMSVNDTERYPRLAEEVAWIHTCVASTVPFLGVCLGAQLLACATGSSVGPAAAKEIGFGPVEILDEADPVVGPLAPLANVLHWHGEVFDLPVGGRQLACSEATEVQAFRVADAWGLLFHAEADAELVELWLREPAMTREARCALGAQYAEKLRREALAVDLARTGAVFAAFAERCRARI